MLQPPSAVNLMLCDQVVYEEGTQKPYLLGVFTSIAAIEFPTAPQRFDIFAALTDGVGRVTITLAVLHLDTDEEIYTHNMDVDFLNPLHVINLRFRIRQLEFEVAGSYLFALSVGEHEIAAARVRVYQRGESP